MTALEQIQLLRQNLPPATPENVVVRERLLLEARNLMLDLERQDNVVERLTFQLMETTMVRTAIKMGLFKVLNQSESTTVDEVAKHCNSDPILTGRILRCLASFGAIKETGRNMYGPRTTSYTFVERTYEAALEFCYDILFRGWLAIPKYLEERKWQNPRVHTDTPIAKAYNRTEGASLWEIIKANSAEDAFNIYMGGFNAGHKDWVDIYPVIERLGEGADKDPSSVMMVDVGGGYGHQALGLKRKYPQLPGRFIVQDIPQGLPTERNSEVEFMEHDFTQEQPVKGARVYYLRYIVHDWPQDVNVRICNQIREAMKPGYSRLIIHEWVVPEMGPSKFMTAQDFNMMSVAAAMERTLPLHQDYLEKAGLKIVKVYNPNDGISESVIEAEIV